MSERCPVHFEKPKMHNRTEIATGPTRFQVTVIAFLFIALTIVTAIVLLQVIDVLCL